ncbi:MAG: enterobactin exporter EntS [Marmoricola sp.]|nr:enterobactin exporter EntS [Marmoricola sp.]
MDSASALAPLRAKNFRSYFLANTVNTAGSTMAPVALAFAVLHVSNSPTALGAVLAANTIPMVAFLLFGGVLADRLPRVLIVRLGNVACALTQGAAAWLVITDRADLWMLIVLEALNGAVAAVLFPALQGMLPQLVPREDLKNANVLQSLARGALRVIGPSISALLVVGVGAGWALAADAVTWLAAGALLLMVQLPPPDGRTGRTSALSELREGWTLFRTTKWLWVVVLAFGFMNAIHTGAWFTVGPAYAKQTIGAQGWGLLLSAESVGLLVMSAIMLRRTFRRPLLAGMLGIALFGIPILLYGAAPHVGLLVVACFVGGAGIEIFSLGWTLAMQENIEERMLSRAYSYDALGSFVAMPVGQFAYGPLASTFGYHDVLVVSGVGYAAIALATLGSSSVRNLRRAT